MHPRPLVLHLSADYPDPVRNRTTNAVKNFIDRIDACDHLIVSLKRTADPRKCYLREFPPRDNQTLVAMGYWAPPGGLLHRPTMHALAERVMSLIARSGRRPDVIHAHKLTIEGVAARMIARRLGIPYVCSVRGEVESKFFRFKPGLRRYFGQVIGDAAAIYYVSAWFKDWIDARYPGRVRDQSLLPNFVSKPITRNPVAPDRDAWDRQALVTVMDLNLYRKKGLHWLLDGLALARRTHPGLRLDVIGWSNPQAMGEIEAIVARLGLGDAVRFLGTLENAEVMRRLSTYAAFVLPSANETFGMAYVEALLSGVPVLYSLATGIDGYLDGLDVGVGAPLGDVPAIAAGLCTLVERADDYRVAIERQWPEIEGRFGPGRYVDAYQELVTRLAARAPAEPPRAVVFDRAWT
ncbi:MAG TPA: glycosyltransferase [Azospirillaceae bacterium]|nr:glycosyltransferase [Azospirillaceae bacterium]